MTIKAKAFGLALVAVFAMSAVAASGAQAVVNFHSDTNPTITTGQSVEEAKFVTSGGTVKCTEESYKGTMTGTQNGSTWTTTTATVEPTYGGCTAFGFVGATIDVNGCTYVFHLTEATAPPTATVDLVCPAEKEITVTAGSCITHVEPQTGLVHATFANGGTTTETKDITVTSTFSGIKYTETSGCLGGHNGTTQSNGTLNGKETIKGYEDNNGVEGNQVGIWVE
jgi:hypothetical protein